MGYTEKSKQRIEQMIISLCLSLDQKLNRRQNGIKTEQNGTVCHQCLSYPISMLRLLSIHKYYRVPHFSSYYNSNPTCKIIIKSCLISQIFKE